MQFASSSNRPCISDLSSSSSLTSSASIDLHMPSSDQHQHRPFHRDLITTPLPLFPINIQTSLLTVSPEQIHLLSSTVVTLAWNIHETITTPTDTIGIFTPDKLTLIDVVENIYTNLNALKIGQYHWQFTPTSIEKLASYDTVVFQYYNPNNGEIKAYSRPIALVRDPNTCSALTSTSMEDISRPICLKIYDLHATNLQRGVFFKPDPYIKVSLIAGRLHKQLRTSSHLYNQENRTNVIPNTCHPKWYNQSFVFQTFHTDLLEFEVKDKFVKTRPTVNRFLGKLTVHVGFLLDKLNKNTSTFVFNLQRRNYSDHVSGCLMFNAAFIRESLSLTIEGDTSSITNQSEQELTMMNDHIASPIVDEQIISRTLPDVPSEHRTLFDSITTDSSLSVIEPLLNTLSTSTIDEPLSATSENINTGNGSMDDANQMLLNPPNQPMSTTSRTLTPTHSSSLTSQYQGRNDEEEIDDNEEEQADENNIDDNQHRQRKDDGDEEEEDASHNCADGSTAAVVPSIKKQLKHCHSSSALLPPLLPRITSTITTRSMLRHQPRHESVNAYRTLQLPITSSNKLLIVTPHGQQRLSTTTGSENNLRTKGIRRHTHNNSNSCLDDETIRSLSRELRQAARDLHRIQTRYDPSITTQQNHNNTECPTAEQTRKLITRELQEWHEQQVSKYKRLAMPSESIDERVPTPVSLHREEEEEQMTIASALPESEDPTAKTTSTSSFILTEESITMPPSITTSLSLIKTHNSMDQDDSRFHESAFMVVLPRKTVTVDTTVLPPPPPSISTTDPPSPPIINASPPLPTGWEKRIDQFGRPYFIDHNNKMTTWQRPIIVSHSTVETPRLPIVAAAAAITAITSSPAIDRERMDKRYQSIRRTNIHRATTTTSVVDSSGVLPIGNDSSSSSSSSSAPMEDFRNTPALQFICRPDFYSFFRSHREARSMTKSDSLAGILQRIRTDPSLFKRYQHNKELVRFLNLFAEPNRSLPPRWDIKHDDSGKLFFVDHNTRSTTYIDPRLPVEPNNDEQQQPAAAMALPSQSSLNRNDDNPSVPLRVSKRQQQQLVNLTYNEKVVAFMRQVNIFDLLKANQLVPLTSKLRDKIQLIRSEGVRALDSLSNSVDLSLLISVFHEDIMSYVPPLTQPTTVTTSHSVLSFASPSSSSSFIVEHPNPPIVSASRRSSNQQQQRQTSSRRPCFQQKLRAFYKKLDSKGYATGPAKTKVSISRNNLLSDAFDKFMNQIPKKDLQRNKLFITFHGEEGLDYGGPSREFFLLMSRQFFNPYYGFFEYSASDQYTLQISPMSKFNDNYREWMRFGGRMLAVALINQYLVDAFLARPLYKALLRDHQTFTLADLESLDPEFHQSLLWIKENNVEDQDLYFYVNEDQCGKIIEKELKIDGKHIQVTERNKREFLDLIIKWRIERGVQEQIDCFVRGFYEIIGDHKLISSMFDARELELALCGTMEIDLNDWRIHTEYRGGYHSQHHVIEWFWLCVEKRFDNEQRLKLLQFVTGTSSIPYEGFSALRGSNGPRRFCIERWGITEALPRAHTCFNRLDLPSYTSYEMLHQKLLLAIEETNTFGIQ